MSHPASSPSNPPLPTPTLANVPYGSDARQILDFWQAPSSKPTPLLFYVHGGGWLNNDKSKIEINEGISGLLAAGISVVSISYRYVKQTILTGEESPARVVIPNPAVEINPPVKVPLDDAARALQWVRSRAAEWNIDKTRIAASGASAGACTCLWLGFHRDLADPASIDPVARESTRLSCVAVMNAQTTLDPRLTKEWTPNSCYGGHAFGFAWNPKDTSEEFHYFLAHREIVLPWFKEYSPLELVTADAPPVYLLYTLDTPAIGEERPDPTHTSNFGLKLQERLRQLKVPCELVYTGAPDVQHPTLSNYLFAQLLG